MRIIPLKSEAAITMIEIVVVVAIIGIMAAAFIGTMAGTKASNNLDRGIQGIRDDIVLIRSRAVSTNTNHRINFSSSSEWVLEFYNESSTSWDVFTDIRRMPADTNLTTDAMTNAAANLEATPRGLFDFKNGSSGDPYVTLTSLGSARTKSIRVELGGAVDIHYD